MLPGRRLSSICFINFLASEKKRWEKKGFNDNCIPPMLRCFDLQQKSSVSKKKCCTRGFFWSRGFASIGCFREKRMCTCLSHNTLGSIWHKIRCFWKVCFTKTAVLLTLKSKLEAAQFLGWSRKSGLTAPRGNHWPARWCWENSLFAAQLREHSVPWKQTHQNFFQALSSCKVLIFAHGVLKFREWSILGKVGRGGGNRIMAMSMVAAKGCWRLLYKKSIFVWTFLEALDGG